MADGGEAPPEYVSQPRDALSAELTDTALRQRRQQQQQSEAAAAGGGGGYYSAAGDAALIGRRGLAAVPQQPQASVAYVSVGENSGGRRSISPRQPPPLPLPPAAGGGASLLLRPAGLRSPRWRDEPPLGEIAEEREPPVAASSAAAARHAATCASPQQRGESPLAVGLGGGRAGGTAGGGADGLERGAEPPLPAAAPAATAAASAAAPPPPSSTPSAAAADPPPRRPRAAVPRPPPRPQIEAELSREGNRHSVTAKVVVPWPAEEAWREVRCAAAAAPSPLLRAAEQRKPPRVAAGDGGPLLASSFLVIAAAPAHCESMINRRSYCFTGNADKVLRNVRAARVEKHNPDGSMHVYMEARLPAPAHPSTQAPRLGTRRLLLKTRFSEVFDPGLVPLDADTRQRRRAHRSRLPLHSHRA